MRIPIKPLLICLAIPLSMIVVLGVIKLPVELHYRHVHHQLRNTDHATILASCRIMISNRRNYLDESPDCMRMTNCVQLFAKSTQFKTAVPLIIQELDPAWVMISDTEVMIYLKTAPRTLVRAYAPEAEQRGSYRLIDGLWVWTGDEYDKL